MACTCPFPAQSTKQKPTDQSIIYKTGEELVGEKQRVSGSLGISEGNGVDVNTTHCIQVYNCRKCFKLCHLSSFGIFRWKPRITFVSLGFYCIFKETIYLKYQAEFSKCCAEDFQYNVLALALIKPLNNWESMIHWNAEDKSPALNIFSWSLSEL